MSRPPAPWRARLASTTAGASASKLALLACAALYSAYALQRTAEAGPSHLFELVFVLGAIALVVAATWLMPFLGSLLLCGGGTAVWIFLDTTPDNAWLAGAAFVAMAFSLRRWMKTPDRCRAERRPASLQDDAATRLEACPPFGQLAAPVPAQVELLE
jgi:hypothetical protein